MAEHAATNSATTWLTRIVGPAAATLLAAGVITLAQPEVVSRPWPRNWWLVVACVVACAVLSWVREPVHRMATGTLLIAVASFAQATWNSGVIHQFEFVGTSQPIWITGTLLVVLGATDRIRG